MTIDIYHIADDPRKLTKTLGSGNLIGSYEVRMKEGGNVLRPSFTVSGGDLSHANYCYIPRYERYYFIDPPIVQPSGVWEMQCHVDVLMSHAAELKALTVTLDRSETIFNGYLPDAEYNAKGYRAIVAKQFPVALDDDNYVLITTG